MSDYEYEETNPEETRKFVSRYERSQMSDIDRLKFDLERARDQLNDFNIDNRGISDSYVRIIRILDNEYFTIDRPDTYQPHLLILGMWLIDPDKIDDIQFSMDNYTPLYPIDDIKYNLLSNYKFELETFKLEPISALKYINLLTQYELAPI